MTDDEHAESPPTPDEAGPATDPPFRPPVRPATEPAEDSVAHQADAVDTADDQRAG